MPDFEGTQEICGSELARDEASSNNKKPQLQISNFPLTTYEKQADFRSLKRLTPSKPALSPLAQLLL
ncbi:hypothetical protein [Pseudomonas vancouverensis]|uniref:Uncharacterized protein n=1 Tax=Pseudomonas vancouverensis TaxID=95300 RepID=A0A1H2P9N8_PSEVA|nr:hypothetical protein [Pseudomonas vancouverensis]KAB0500173.1 hypothetical protein F7R09_03070 [Pseudomonas vancouverensis]TDB68662.1 hypothetical protein EIY72_02040 [Pseudomonas vancouverensis]SDV13716.1 hypothetical protein SAMN05216558_4062 [Pseudomonas vancouverensis]